MPGTPIFYANEKVSLFKHRNKTIRMKQNIGVPIIMLYAIMLSGCQKTTTLTITERREAPAQTDNKILIDASRDGGIWWFPQSNETGFSSDADHQGKELANYLRRLDYEVYELPRGTIITDDLLSQYDKVIRAGGFGTYTSSEIKAYDHFINRTSSLILLQDHLLNFANDNLSEHLGVQFAGGLDGNITVFTSNPITAGVTSMYYGFGSVVINAINNSTMTILGSLDGVSFHPNAQSDDGVISSPAVMGTLNSYPNCRIFFMGDINGLETIPQPFVNNLIQWAFK